MTTVRCKSKSCRTVLAEVWADPEGRWFVTTYPNILARRLKDAFRPHGDDHVKFQLDAIQRHERSPLDAAATYTLECDGCVRRADVTGNHLRALCAPSTFNKDAPANVYLRLAIPAHVDPVPEVPPSQGREVRVQFHTPEGTESLGR